jgi:hypothetical protein
MFDDTPNARPTDRSWTLVWWNVTGLALVLTLSLAATGLAGTALDLLDDAPELSPAGRVLGFAGGLAALAGGALALTAYRARSRGRMLGAYGLLLLAIALLVGMRLA